MARWQLSIPALMFGFFTTAAVADPIPDPIVQIITEAAKTGNADTLRMTVDLAKKTNPRSVAEIDALVASLQQNAEAERVARLSAQGFLEGWSGEGEAGGSLTSGTSESKALALGVNLTKEGLQWRHKIAALANYQKSAGTTSAEQYRASYEANYKFTPDFFALGLLQWEQDRFAGFIRRFTESVGVGYTIVNRPGFNWQVSGGPALRQTRLVTHVSESDTSLHAATAVTWNLTDSTVFTESAGLYVGGNDNTYQSTTALTTKLMGNLSARASFDIMVESDPPPGIDDTNTITRFTLVYSF